MPARQDDRQVMGLREVCHGGGAAAQLRKSGVLLREGDPCQSERRKDQGLPPGYRAGADEDRDLEAAWGVSSKRDRLRQGFGARWVSRLRQGFGARWVSRLRQGFGARWVSRLRQGFGARWVSRLRQGFGAR